MITFRFDYDNPKFNRLIGLLCDFFARMGAQASTVDNIPWLRHLPYFRVSFLANKDNKDNGTITGL